MGLGLIGPVGPVAAVPWPVGGRLPWLGEEVLLAVPMVVGEADGVADEVIDESSFATAASASEGVGGVLGRPETGMSPAAVTGVSDCWAMGSWGTPATWWLADPGRTVLSGDLASANVRCGGHLVSIEEHCGASAMWKSTYNERLAQALRLPLGSGRPLQALLRGSGATRNGKSQHYEGGYGSRE